MAKSQAFNANRVQLPLGFLMPESEWVAPNLDDLPQDWNVFKRTAIDCETKDPLIDKDMGIGVRHGGYTVGYSLAFEDGPSVYLPTRHQGGGNLDPGKVHAYLQHHARSYSGIVTGANLSYDLDDAASDGIEFSSAKFTRDVLINDVLIDELQFSYSLDAVGKRRIGLGKDEGLLRQAAQAYGAKTNADVKKIIYAMPAAMVGPYATIDAVRPLQILRAQERILEDEELNQVYDLESEVLPALVRMRRRGVRIDVDRLDVVDQWAAAQEMEAWALVKRETGVDVALGEGMKVEILARALAAIGVMVKKTSNGKLNIDKFVLDSIDHPVATAIRRGRKMGQLRGTFVGGIRRYMVNGRIHCTFNQLRKSPDNDEETTQSDDMEGTITGRLSCVDPNLQQQPNRDKEIGPMWRSIYIPEEGKLWAVNDYSKQEPRLLVHWACAAGAGRIGPHAHRAALAMAARYQEDRNLDPYKLMAEMAGVEYTDSKTLSLGKTYGMMDLKLCRSLRLPTEKVEIQTREGPKWVERAGPEGRAIMDRFDANVPFAKAMLDADQKQARNKGWIRTIFGRKLHFERDPQGNVMFAYRALNKRIQGSAADQTKKALRDLDREGAFLQLQIHDELDGSVEDRKEGERWAEIMEQAVTLKIPCKASLKIGTNWGNCE